MLISTLRWDADDGWSAPFPDVDSPSTLVLAFGPSALLDEPGPLRTLVAAFPQATVMGCSSSGEIDGDSVNDDSLIVSITRFESVRLTQVHLEVPDAAGSRQAGEQLARRLLEHHPDLQAAFVLSDGLGVNGSTLVEGLTAVLPPEVIITGGLAGDADRFERTWVIVDGEVRRGHACAVGLSGPDLVVGFGSQGGWEIFGPERRITRSEGNVLYELDGQPALSLYKKYLGDRAEGLPATALLFPLALRIPGAEHRQVVRTVLATDEVAQSMTFAGDVPEDSLAQLMRASFERLVDGAEDAAERAALVPPFTQRNGNGSDNVAAFDADAPMLAVISAAGSRPAAPSLIERVRRRLTPKRRRTAMA